MNTWRFKKRPQTGSAGYEDPRRNLGAARYASGHRWTPNLEVFFRLMLGLLTGIAMAIPGQQTAPVLLVHAHNSATLPYLVEVAKANPEDPEELFVKVSTELKLKQLDEARRDLPRLESLSEEHPQLLDRLGKLLSENRLLDEAEREFEHVASIMEAFQAQRAEPPKDLNISHVYLQIAQLRFNRHDYWGALQYFGKIGPGGVEPRLQAGTLNLEGACLLAVGKLRDAQAKFRRATQLEPSKSEYFVHSAWADLLAGDKESARATAEIARSRWPGVPEVQQLVALVEREAMPERARVPFSGTWHLQGTGFICCPCAVPCPCRSNGPPTDGHCEFAGAVHISRGHYGSVSLDGLVFAIADDAMNCQHRPSVLYVARSATDDELVALERVFQSFDPSQPFVFLLVKRAALSFVDSPQEGTYEAEIPDILHTKIRRRLDAGGHPLLRTAALDSYSNIIEYTRNLIDRVSDEEAGLKWDYSGHQANFRSFDLDDHDYKLGNMLAQFADGTGFFNKRQLDLIRELKLPMLTSYPNQPKELLAHSDK
jgi:Flp pilus assembly protein TadD